MTRIVYSGAAVSNGGDAAIMAAQIATLDEAYPGHLVVLHDDRPGVARRLFPACEALPATAQVVRLPRGSNHRARVRRTLSRGRLLGAAHLWRIGGVSLAKRLLRDAEVPQFASLAEAHLVAYTGGTSLIEAYDVEGKTFELAIARALGTPVVLLPQSLGPFRSSRNQRLVKETVAGAAVALLRDDRSKDHLARIGAPMQRVSVVPDVVFALTTDDAARSLARSHLPAHGARVAVSVRDCRKLFTGTTGGRALDQVDYEAAVGALVTHLVRERRASVTFLSTCQGVPEYWTDDSAVAMTVAAGLPVDVRAEVSVDRTHRNTEQLRSAFAAFDLVVCTRLHAAILALAGGTAVLPIAYEFKTHEVMRQLGLGHYVTDAQGATAARLVDRLEQLTVDWVGVRGSLAERLTAMAIEARSTGERVRAAVDDV